MDTTEGPDSTTRSVASRFVRLAGLLPRSLPRSEQDAGAAFERILASFDVLQRAEAAAASEDLSAMDPADPPSFGAAETVSLRDDDPEPSLPVREALAGAPDVRDGCFAVPRYVRK